MTASSLLAKIQARTARAGVIGLGYVGLPLAVEFARAGLPTTGIDLDGRKVDEIMAGHSYIPDVPTADVAALRRAGTLTATTDFSVIRELDTVNICVPTPLRKTKDPDMSFVVSAAEQIAEYLHPGLLIVLESTTYPGTTAELLQPMFEARGLRVGVDIFLAFSPERVDPANERFHTKNTPKVVGGTTPSCLAVASALYATAIDTIVPVSSTRVAEMVKLLENTFRAVNIGLVNELALMCDRMGIDVWEVVDAARTKPFGFMPFYPGPGLGGHCIPIDPFYLSWKAKEAGFEARFIELAGHVNASMPHYVADKVAEALNTARKAVNGSSVLVLGVTYKKDIDDLRESPALDVMHVLQDRGARVSYSDPHAPRLGARDWPGRQNMQSLDLTPEALAQHDITVILTDHGAFDYQMVLESAPLILDTRNALGACEQTHVFRLGAPRRLVAPSTPAGAAA
jgi:UDP-N-acetyl-D-glucosamine dehydrogenase